MAITKYSDISALVNDIYERSLFVVRETNLMANLVSNYNAQGWMTRQFSSRPEITAETVADGVDYENPQTFGKTAGGTLTPVEAIAQVRLTDRMVETDPDGARNDAATELGASIAHKLDTDLTGVFSAFATDKGTGAGNAATLASLAAALAVVRNRMKSAGPPSTSARLRPIQRAGVSLTASSQSSGWRWPSRVALRKASKRS